MNLLRTIEPLAAALFTLAWMAHACAGNNVVCHQDGRYVHCWDARTGAALTTTELGDNGYYHTWDADGYILKTPNNKERK